MAFFPSSRLLNMTNLYGSKSLTTGLFGVLRRLGPVRCIPIEIFSSTLTGPTYSASIFSNLWDNSGLLTLGGATVTVPMTPGASADRELSGDMFRNDLYRSSDDEADLLNGSPKEMGKVELSGRPKPNPILWESLLFSSLNTTRKEINSRIKMFNYEDF